MTTFPSAAASSGFQRGGGTVGEPAAVNANSLLKLPTDCLLGACSGLAIGGLQFLLTHPVCFQE